MHIFKVYFLAAILYSARAITGTSIIETATDSHIWFLLKLVKNWLRPYLEQVSEDAINRVHETRAKRQICFNFLVLFLAHKNSCWNFTHSRAW